MASGGYTSVMVTENHDAGRQARLQTIADLLDVEPQAFEDGSQRTDTMEMLLLWLKLPRVAERMAALAYLRLLALGIPR